MAENDWAGTSVLVTGAASGIGRAIAVLAGEAGARLMLGDIDAAGLEAAAHELRARGCVVGSRVCDVRSTADIEALVEAACDTCGEPDAVFANAGVLGAPGEPWEASEADFARIVDVNLMGTWRTLKATLPRMVARGSGAIVATASVAGLVGAPGLAAYVASKHGIVGLIRSTALSVAAAGVRVNVLCPHLIETPMVDALGAADPDFRAALVEQSPSRRMGAPAEAAAAALWLASPASAYVVGHALVVDGGYTVQ